MPYDKAGPDQITGLIERITYHSPDTGFTVLKVAVGGQKDLVSVVGAAAEVRAGEWVDARGKWVIDATHGRQFKADLLKSTPPDTAEGMQKYLASGLVKGIGPKFAARLVEKFGAEVFRVIEEEPKKLLEVAGIGPGRQSRILRAWKDQQAVRQIMVFLHSHGVGTSRAFRIYKTYGDDSIQRVREDPYRLARDIWGIGFKTADQIAASLGIAKQSDLRARAGVEHALRELGEEGHCAYPRQGLAERAGKMLDIPMEIIQRAIEHGLNERRLVLGVDERNEVLVYLGTMHQAEARLAGDLVRLLNERAPTDPVRAVRPEVATDWAEQQVGFRLADGQREALRVATESKVCVITGGPGVGKTTVVDAIVRILQRIKLDVVLCAPTGRAAKRLAETTNCDATTIHRLLEFDAKMGAFKRNDLLPLEGDVFVIDETSMMDLMLAHQMVRAIPKHARLILVGDVDQLPPVGAGSVLRDVIDSGVIPVCRLTEVFRQAASSDIVVNAHRINQGTMAVFPRKRDDARVSDCYFVNCEEPAKAQEMILRLIREAIPRRFGLRPIDDIQLLTPMQRGELGARTLNALLQQALNPRGASVERFGRTCRVGDKVMQTVNNYDKHVYNGDIGRIRALDETEHELLVAFDDRDVVYDFEELDELTHSFATTVHKSQGSEYPAVVIALHTQHYTMLQRNLLYTALTRGKKLVVLVGSMKALAMAIQRTDLSKRVTTLAQRLREKARGEAGEALPVRVAG